MEINQFLASLKAIGPHINESICTSSSSAPLLSTAAITDPPAPPPFDFDLFLRNELLRVAAEPTINNNNDIDDESGEDNNNDIDDESGEDCDYENSYEEYDNGEDIYRRYRWSIIMI